MAADSAICGAELWTSDGTSGGTVMVLDINSGASGSTPRYFRYVNGTVLFAADDGSHGVELWKSDGTGGNTALVLDINSSGSTSSIFPLDDWAVVGNTLYFVPDDGTHGYELWKSDGTTGGTVMVKDINPGGGNGIAHDTVSWFTVTGIDGSIYFRANDGTHGSELWKTDGTSAGTGMFQDIYAGASSSNPRYITKLNDQLFFSGTTAAGIKLWSVDPRVSDLYYTSEWQVAEERINGVMTQQNVWSMVYVDAVIVRDRDLDGDGQVDDERLYPMHDANFNVTGVVDAAGDLVERYFNDTYGAPTVLDANWSADGDGVSDVSFIYLHQGGRYDATTKMYHFRRREYDPSLGRWTSPDPMGYIDGANVYVGASNNPVARTDPLGLFDSTIHAEITRAAAAGLGIRPPVLNTIIEFNILQDVPVLGNYTSGPIHAQSKGWIKSVSSDLTTPCYSDNLGRALHTLQDFYSHTDWVDGAAAISRIRDYWSDLRNGRIPGPHFHHPDEAKWHPGHKGQTIPVDALLAADISYENVNYFVGGGGWNGLWVWAFGDSSDHSRYAADRPGHGRDNVEGPLRGIGISGAHEQAKRDAIAQTKEVLEWAVQNNPSIRE